MKTDNKIVLASFGAGVFLWFADAWLDYFIFYEGGFVELLITDIPRHELYIRLVILVCFIVFGVICARLINDQQKTAKELASALAFQQQLLNTMPVPVFYKNAELVYTGCNKSFEDFLGMSREDIIGKSVHDLAPAKLAAIYHAKDTELLADPGVQIYEFEVQGKDASENRQVIFHKATFENYEGQVGGFIGVILDITELKKAESVKRKLIVELQAALDKVQLLGGFLPICASCKKIRDDQGYWQQIEMYISENSEAEFSHSICPDCAQQLYPEFVGKLKQNKTVAKECNDENK